MVDGSRVKHYSFDGSGFSYNAALSVTSGLTSPSCVALRPGTYDRLIVDGDQVKYYMWDGSQLVYNPQLSVTVAGLQNVGGYAPSAQAQSQGKDPGASVAWVRVRASLRSAAQNVHYLAVTADGSAWVTRWRVVGLDGGGTRLEVSPDDGRSWDPIGEASRAWPTADTLELWGGGAGGPGGGLARDPGHGGPGGDTQDQSTQSGRRRAVVWEAGNAPQKPVIPSRAPATRLPPDVHVGLH